MNILTSSLPAAVTLEGRCYKIRTDFRTWILISEIIGKAGAAGAAAALCYIDMPPSPRLALEGIAYFLTRGEKGGAEPLYSFDADADYIYSAFLTQYGIDLTVSDLHWWKFISLFRGLGDEHKISKLMALRGLDLNNISDKKLRARLTRLKRGCAIKRVCDISAAFDSAGGE